MRHYAAVRADRPSPSDQSDRWTPLVRLTLATYRDAHGAREATRRLRAHMAHWPAPARHALARIAGEGGGR